jgi:hypothetical protein
MSPQPAPTPDSSHAAVRRKHPYFWFLSAFLVLSAAAAIFVWQTRMPVFQAVTVQPMTVEVGPEWLGPALTEEIAGVLRPVTKAAAEPGVTAVIDGLIARSSDRVRVTVRLSRPDGHRYWTRTFERPLPEIAAEVAGAVVPLPRGRAPHRKPTPEAFESYFEARHLFRHDEVGKAIDGFQRATELDPQFALAWAWLSIAKEKLVEEGAARPNGLLPAARDAAERAVTLDPDTVETHVALGIMKLQYDWNWDGARREFERALELDPGAPLALHWRDRWREAMNLSPAEPVQLPIVPRDVDDARRLLADADELRAQKYINPITFVLAASLANNTKDFWDWLEVAYEERCVQLPYLLRSPSVPQSDPRLRDLLRRLRLPARS